MVPNVESEIDLKVIACIKKFIVDSGRPSRDVQVTDNFSDYKNFDSLDQVEMVMDIEDYFNIEIPDDEAEKIKSIQDIVDCVKTKVK
jgi:acyl carrier protein